MTLCKHTKRTAIHVLRGWIWFVFRNCRNVCVLFHCVKLKKRSNVLTNTNKPHQIEWMRFHFLMPVRISLKVVFFGEKEMCFYFLFELSVHSMFLLLFFTTPFSGMLKSCPFYNVIIHVYLIFYKLEMKRKSICSLSKSCLKNLKFCYNKNWTTFNLRKNIDRFVFSLKLFII